MVRPQKWDLIIVGSGAGGLVLALELAKKGLQIAILDRQPHPGSLPRGRLSSRTASAFSTASAFFRNFSPPIFIEMSVWTSFKKKDRFSAPSIIVSSLLLIPIL
ncbi:MAG: NAD(P)/FAD-dependent oxidoreductase [Candidatus Manganitrophus sp.]|nr:NAD(P)/FAD-dependent oxidoreductase [Candidatus Manganitrophus sp.]